MSFRLPADDKLPQIQDGNTRPGPYHWGIYHAIRALEEQSRSLKQAAWLYEFDQKVMRNKKGVTATPVDLDLPMIPVVPPPARPTPPTPPNRPTPPIHAMPPEEHSPPPFSRSASTGRGTRRKTTREVIEEEEDASASTHEAAPSMPLPHMPPPMPPPPAHQPPLPPPSRYQPSDDEESFGDEEGFDGDDDGDGEGDDGDDGGDDGHPRRGESHAGQHRALPESQEVLPPDGSIPLPPPAQIVKGVDPLVAQMMQQNQDLQRSMVFLMSEVKMASNRSAEQATRMAQASAEESRRASQMTQTAAEKYSQLSIEQASNSMGIVNSLAETLQANNVNNINLTNQMSQTAISLLQQMTASSLDIIKTLDQRVKDGEGAQIQAMSTLGRAMAREAQANAIITNGGPLGQQQEVQGDSGEEEDESSGLDAMMGGALKSGLEKGVTEAVQGAVGAGFDKAIEKFLPKIMEMFMSKGGGNGGTPPT